MLRGLKITSTVRHGFNLLDRLENNAEFLERTTPLRRALMGDFKRSEEPYGLGYERPPFMDEGPTPAYFAGFSV